MLSREGFFVEIDVEEAIKRTNLKLIDLRSPGEHKTSSIPGSINIPLFNDDEYHQLGLLYHSQGENAARRMALQIISPRLPALVDSIVKNSEPHTPLLYCSRGGMRSQSVEQVLNMAGIRAYRLRNGYKAHRRYVVKQLAEFSLEGQLIVLNGLTGVGKTILLKMLSEMGEPVIDLENLACHRGSVFGAVGLDSQRSQKDFDAILLNKLETLKDFTYIFIEGEGKRIGNIYLPRIVCEAIEKGKHILLQASLNKRVQRILDDYKPEKLAGDTLDKLNSALQSLQSRVGREKIEMLRELFEKKDFPKAVEILCIDYYDQLYSDSKPETAQFDQVLNADNLEETARELINLANHNDL